MPMTGRKRYMKKAVGFWLESHCLYIVLLLVVYECADVFAVHDFFEVAHDVHVEDVDRKVVLFAHCCGSEVHDLEPFVVDFVVCDF